MSFSVGNRLIAALDVASRAEADALIARLGGVPAFYKIGLELFCAEGPSLVADYARAGRALMLDLKLHDIPETVARATARVAQLGAKLVTVHASGGAEMLAAAVRAAKDSGTQILAITALTSLDAADLAAIGVAGDPLTWAIRLAQLAASAGCDGVVTSPREVAAIRAAVRPEFLVVTPGIRPATHATADQKRTADPRTAIEAGADLLVVGRPLRDAADPEAAARAITFEIAAASRPERAFS